MCLIVGGGYVEVFVEVCDLWPVAEPGLVAGVEDVRRNAAFCLSTTSAQVCARGVDQPTSNDALSLLYV